MINPNIDKEITVAVAFSSKEESSYQILSKSYDSNPSFSAAAGTVTVPANCYVSIGSLEVNEVKNVWSDSSASIRLRKDGCYIVVDHTDAPVAVFSADGRRIATLQEAGRIEVNTGVYVVTNGKETIKIVF